jgi:hypothetical protein
MDRLPIATSPATTPVFCIFFSFFFLHLFRIWSAAGDRGNNKNRLLMTLSMVNGMGKDGEGQSRR